VWWGDVEGGEGNGKWEWCVRGDKVDGGWCEEYCLIG
jgi:hypothetical protein